MRTFLRAYWKDIVMINYEVPKELLIPYLPYGTELDDFEGKYYVSLVGFKFLESSILGITIPFYGSFDEVNLRFYVKRNIHNEVRRGVVFISEIVPNKMVAFLANKLYKEHYSSAKMKSDIKISNNEKHIHYIWYKQDKKYEIRASFKNIETDMIKDTHEHFIYEHYHGYTKINKHETWEYKVNHPKWKINKNISYEVSCDFELLYGKSYAFLQNEKPHSVYNSVGSEVSIDWEINKIINETNQKRKPSFKSLRSV